MIHANILKRRADDDGLTARAIERDYVLAHVLAAIATRDEHEQIAFKGGTALRLCHFESYRYSADLDFSLVDGLSVEGARALCVEALAECKERVGFPVLRTRPACRSSLAIPIRSPAGVSCTHSPKWQRRSCDASSSACNAATSTT